MGLLIEDLGSRRVVRVAVEYVLVTAGLLLTLGMVEARFGLPDWTLRRWPRSRSSRCRSCSC